MIALRVISIEGTLWLAGAQNTCSNSFFVRRVTAGVADTAS